MVLGGPPSRGVEGAVTYDQVWYEEKDVLALLFLDEPSAGGLRGAISVASGVNAHGELLVVTRFLFCFAAVGCPSSGVWSRHGSEISRRSSAELGTVFFFLV